MFAGTRAMRADAEGGRIQDVDEGARELPVQAHRLSG